MEVTKAEHAPSSVEKFAESRARAGLETLFAPKSVAVIGATERLGTVGRTVLWNLIESRFRAKVYAVNPTHSEILGLKAYKGVGDIQRTWTWPSWLLRHLRFRVLLASAWMPE